MLNKISNVIDCTFTYWLLRTTDWLGWSTFANHSIRPIIFRLYGLNIGRECHISTGLTVHSKRHRVIIGHHTTINKNCLLDAPAAPIQIGNYCSIGFNVSIINADHLHDISPNGRRELAITEPVKIEDYVWIGSNVTILPGVRIGTGSIIGAGAVVTKDVPPHSLALGVPAKVVKELQKPSKLLEATLQ